MEKETKVMRYSKTARRQDIIKQAKQDVRITKFHKKKRSKEYRTLKRKKSDVTKIQEQLAKARQQYKQAKKTRKYVKRQYVSRRSNPLKQFSHRQVAQTTDTVLGGDETLERLSSFNAKRQQAESSYELGKAYSRYMLKGSWWGAKKSYNISNRTYNLTRGRGFKKTPVQSAWYTQLKKRLHYQKRLSQVRQLSPIYKPFKKFFQIILRNPFSWLGLFILTCILMILSLLSTSVLRQNEFDLTDTWNYLSQQDRFYSTDKVIYYSNIDDSLFYINYRYDHLKKQLVMTENLMGTDLGRQYVETLWKDLNGNPDNLKSMRDLYTDNNTPYYLSDKEQQQYEEFQKVAQEVGKYIALRELANFLLAPEDKSKTPLVITKRHGYIDKETLSETSTFKAEGGAYVYASMSGTVSIVDNQFMLLSGKKRLTFFDLDNVRFTDGQEVKQGDMIGQVKSSSNQEVKYEKQRPIKIVELPTDNIEAGTNSDEYIDPDDPQYAEKVAQREEQQKALKEKSKDTTLETGMEWKAVNIGFYLPNITYTQSTSVIKDVNLDSDKVQRVRAFVNAIKARIPNATDEGISAILGNFEIESDINPKRVEGDHLNAPIGPSSEADYDSPEWLAMGGMAIYGKYPNIINRGIGLGQWTNTADGSTRHTLLREYAKLKGKNWYDLDLQVDFMVNGDTPYYKQVFYDVITSQDTVEQLTTTFLNKWEGNPNNKVESRIASAKSWLGFLTSSPVGQPLEDMHLVKVSSHFDEFRQLVSQEGQFFESRHSGIDLVYQDGRSHAPIYTVDSGEVVHVGYAGTAGLAVIVKHANYYSYYFHLSATTVQVGSYINVGDQVGNMGSTGRSTGEHLHLGFSYQLWSDFYDPAPYLQLK